jgi:hypothetical protein
MAMKSGGHPAEESGKNYIVGGGEAMSAQEEVVPFQPSKDAGVALQVPEQLGAANAEEDMNDFGVLVGVSWGILESAKVLVEAVASHWDVTFHCECTGH